MKILSVAIPCYNSAEYMSKAIESVLVAGEDVEILIVNDGSKDDTAKIGREYEEKYPTICKLINKENGGHGDAVNFGLANATGHYFKVLDSDDWFAKEPFKKIINFLKDIVEQGTELDLLISNYVYDKVGETKKKAVKYKRALPEGRIFTWSEIGRFKHSQNILMHSVIYRTEVLRECNLVLPKHTFYVDNIFVFKPLPYCKSIYYMNVNLYHYFIGRDDQSVNETVMMSRIDQQLRVNKLMIDYLNAEHSKLTDKKCRKYMEKYLNMIMIVSSVYLIKIGTDESLAKRDELWDYLKKSDDKVYSKLRHNSVGAALNTNNWVGRKVVQSGYKVSKKIFKFN
ncbi:MAG: glycosyltransferase family 2 protein [Lachnospiraceae bacterium]|nr:glycosyltransferase family 2 protein [Lachnospiraceae bacterium]